MTDATTGQGRTSAPWTISLVIDRFPTATQSAALPPDVSITWAPDTAIVRAHLTVPAATLPDAVADAVRTVGRVGLRALRVDSADWVTRQDIADRAGRCRETVRLWAAGRMGPGGFPPPLNPGQDTTFYSWSEVHPWLQAHLGVDLPEPQPTLAATNLILHLRSITRQLDEPTALWRLLRQLHQPNIRPAVNR